MTKINKALINILICVKPFYFNYILYFRFSLHNSTGEASGGFREGDGGDASPPPA